MKRVMIGTKVAMASNVVKLQREKIREDRAKKRKRCERKIEYNGETLFQSTET